MGKAGAPKKPAKDVKQVMAVRTKPALKAALKEAADADGRPVSQYVERLLEKDMREAGFLK